MITIRKYRPADLAATIAIFQRAVSLIASRDYSQQQIDAWIQVDRSEWQQRLESSDVWVACDADRVVGFTSLVAGGHLDLLFSDADHQRCGVATLLLDMLEQVAREKGLTQVVTEASITAKHFFEQRGYRLLKQQIVVVRGQRFIQYRMRRQLNF